MTKRSRHKKPLPYISLSREAIRADKKRREDAKKIEPAKSLVVKIKELEVVAQFDFSSRAINSCNDHTWFAMPASIAGVTRNVWWMRQKL